jgi:hypothetical protein
MIWYCGNVVDIKQKKKQFILLLMRGFGQIKKEKKKEALIDFDIMLHECIWIRNE